MPAVGTSKDILGGGGCRLQTYRCGPDDGRLIVALHGIAQSSLAYAELAAAADEQGWNLVTVDLRGQGDSAKPTAAYGDSQLWADDVAAVLRAYGAAPGAPATLLGWSYGGAVIGDYLAAYGTDVVGSVVTVGATYLLGAPVGPYVQPQFGALTKAIATDDTGAVLAQLQDLCTVRPLRAGRCDELLAASLKCPAYVRSGMLRRTLDHTATFAALDRPLLVVHGRQDQMFTFELAERLAALTPGATLSAYDDAGHMPLWDEPERFIAEVAEFVR